MKHKKKFLGLVLCFFLLMGLSLSAQELQTGAIRGKVADDKGEPLPGVTITITGPALQGKVTSITNQEGVYRAPGLPPGSDYEIRAELAGFETVIRKGIIVSVGRVITVDLQMKPSTLAEEITVTASSPTVDVVKSSKSTQITSEALSSLPMGRNLRSILNVSPGTVGRSLYGSGGAEVGVVVDGIKATDPYGNEPGIGYDTGMPWDMVEEVQIITTGASAEYYGAAMGQTVVVMKNGGNKLMGEFSFYYTNNHLVQFHLPDVDLKTLKVSKPSVPLYNYDSSAALGGAIIKDKLWYMAEFRYMQSKNSGDFNPTVINGKQYTNYDRAYTDYVGYLKLTFQLAKNVRGNVMANYNSDSSPHYYGGWWRTVEASRHQGAEPLIVSGALSWILDNNTMLDLRVGYYQHNWWSKYPKEANPNGPEYVDDYTGYMWGNEGPVYYALTPKKNITLTFTRYIDSFLGGEHEIKAGVEWEWNKAFSGSYMKQPLVWHYYNESPYYWRAQNNGMTDPIYGDGLLDYLVIGTTHGSTYDCGLTSRIGGFFQDSFKIKRLTLNAGVRLDTIKSWVPAKTKGAASDPVALSIGDTIFKPVYGFNAYGELSFPAWKNVFPYGIFISPRVGLTYDLFGNHKTAVKFSFAHQADVFLPGAFIGWSAPSGASFTFNWWDLNNNGIPDPIPIDKYQEAYGATPLSLVDTSYLKMIDPNIKDPYINEISFGLDHELLKDMEVGVHYIFKQRGNLMGSVLWDENTGRYWYTHDKAPEWWIPFKTIIPAYGIFPAKEVTMYFLSNNAPEQFYRLTTVPEAKWKYRSLEVAFNKRMSNGWQLGGSINFSKNPGNYPVDWIGYYGSWNLSQANSFVNSYGEMINSRPIILKLYGTFKLPYQLMFSFIFQHYDGTPWGRTVTVVPPADWAAANNVSSVPYGIYVEPPGTRRNEASDNLDIRLQKDFNIGPGRLGFYMDVFNLLGAYTLTIAKDPGGTWHPVDENTAQGTYTPGSTGLKGFSGYRQFRFSVLYRF